MPLQQQLFVVVPLKVHEDIEEQLFLVKEVSLYLTIQKFFALFPPPLNQNATVMPHQFDNLFLNLVLMPAQHFVVSSLFFYL